MEEFCLTPSVRAQGLLFLGPKLLKIRGKSANCGVVRSDENAIWFRILDECRFFNRGARPLGGGNRVV
jgi:hypothetical protein